MRLWTRNRHCLASINYIHIGFWKYNAHNQEPTYNCVALKSCLNTDAGMQSVTTLLTLIRLPSLMLLPPKASLSLQNLDIWDQFGLIVLLGLLYTFLPGSGPEKGWFDIIWGANGEGNIQNEDSRNIVKVLEKTVRKPFPPAST